MTTRKSTALRDLAQSMDQHALTLESFPELKTWGEYVRRQASWFRKLADDYAKQEPTVRAVEELAGLIPDFTGGLSSEEYVRRMRGGEQSD